MILAALVACILLSTPYAAEDRERISAPVGAVAAVHIFRQTQPGRVNFMVSGCNADLAAALGDQSAPGIVGLHVVSVGGGAWYAAARLSDPGTSLSVRIEDGSISIRSTPEPQAADTGEARVLSVDQLLAGAGTPEPPRPPDGLRFLWGAALAPAIDPLSYQPQLPVFAPGAETGTWAAMDVARRTYLEGSSPIQRAEAAYALGWGYLRLGFLREARYYFDRIPELGSSFDARVTAMARMRAALLSNDWEDARTRVGDAAAAGALPEQIIESLALISLATADPPPAATAHALLAVSAQPQSWLLAAELLQREGLFAASAQILDGLDARIDPALAPQVALRLGDALLVTGDPVGAERAYALAPEPLASLRRLHASLVGMKTSTWIRALPDLTRFARADDRAAPEALYLLAQVHRMFGETRSAIDVLGDMGERFPEVFANSDATQQQLDLFRTMLAPLVEEQRWVEAATLYREVWNDRLLAACTDHRFLIPVADAFEALGLPEEAQRVLRDAFYVVNRQQVDDPALVLRLARLYADEGRHAEALDTLEYLARRPLPEAYRGQRAMLTGLLLGSSGQLAEAKKAYAAAALFPETRDEAQIRLALMDADAGRCDTAIPSLQFLLMSERKLSRRTDPIPFLALARCLMAEGRERDAAVVAREAAGRIPSPEEARIAGYLAFDAKAGEDAAADLDREALLAEPDIWARLGLEDIEDQRFRDQVAARRTSSTAP